MIQPRVTHTGQTAGQSGKVFAPPIDASDVASAAALAAHIADNTDPHTSIQYVNSRVQTPEVRHTGNLQLNVLSSISDRTVEIVNTGVGGKKANLDVADDLQVGGTAGYDGVYDNGDVIGNITINWNNGNVQKITLTGNVTAVAFTNPPNAGNYRLWIYQSGAGTFTVAGWDADAKWGGTAPVVSTTAGNFDLGVFEYDGASTYAAQMAQGVDGLGFNPP